LVPFNLPDMVAWSLGPASFYYAVIEIGTVCASSAWVLSILGVHQFHVGLFPPQAQDEVWGDDSSALVSSSYPPTGKAERVSGGFRLSGSFSSGCDYARWAFLGAVVPSSRQTASAHDITAFLVPRRDYRIEDVWHVAGLAGTGSSDIVIDEAFVPNYRASSFADSYRQRLPGQADNPWPLFRLPLARLPLIMHEYV
jgi:3-hydroxy-9,10-secoandrosta-1,3,5(10)-triene-9,17-dione monooxygenase